MCEIGVIVAFMPMASMGDGIGVRRETELEPGEIERRRNRQQQDQAKAKPLPQRALSVPHPVHGGSLGEAADVRHP